MEKKILDATCATRSIWFDKECSSAVYFDQARRAVKKQDAYYAKCDWPIFRLGVEYGF